MTYVAAALQRAYSDSTCVVPRLRHKFKPRESSTVPELPYLSDNEVDIMLQKKSFAINVPVKIRPLRDIDANLLSQLLRMDLSFLPPVFVV